MWTTMHPWTCGPASRSAELGEGRVARGCTSEVTNRPFLAPAYSQFHVNCRPLFGTRLRVWSALP